MDWKDNRQTKTVCFDDIKVGDVFVWDNIIHIKINRNEAFDICNNVIEEFAPNDIAERRKATLVLD